jgi:hypothetical protein
MRQAGRAAALSLALLAHAAAAADVTIAVGGAFTSLARTTTTSPRTAP